MRNAVMVGMVAAAALGGCNTSRGGDAGPNVERTFQVGAFDRIEVAGPYEVEVRTGGQPGVRASGAERDVERMSVEVRDGKLTIHPLRRTMSFGWSRHRKVAVAVTVPALRGAEIAGSGGIFVDRVAGDTFEGGVAGSGGLRLGQVDARQLKLAIAGSGGIQAAAGRAGNAEYEIAGSGAIEAGGVVAETASIDIAGSGNVRANATRSAMVDIAGSGDVAVTGGAKCTVSKAGSGNVNCG